MIYLIGGPPKCGKTTLAKRLAYKRHVPWISADTLQNIVLCYTPKAKRSALFPHSHRRKGSNDQFYSSYSPEQIVKNYIAQGKATYNAISMIVETYLKDQEDLIVEGYQVTPSIVNRVLKRFGQKNVKAVFLVRCDEQKFALDVRKSVTPNDWILRRTKNEVTFKRIAKMVVEYSRYFEIEAKKYRLKTFEMSRSFNNQVHKIVAYLSLK